MQTAFFRRASSIRVVSIAALLASLFSCTGTGGPGPRIYPPDRESKSDEKPRPDKARQTSLAMAGDVSTQPKEVAAVIDFARNAPVATVSARPIDVIQEKPDLLVEDSCVSCGGAVWRMLLHNMHPNVQVRGDKLFLYEKSNGGWPRVLLAHAKTGEILWMRTLKSTASSSTLYVKSVHFLEQGNIAMVLEDHRGGPANHKLVILSPDGSKVADFDFDDSLSNMLSMPAGAGVLVYGERSRKKEDPVDRFYLALHDAKGRPVGAFLEEEPGQVSTIVAQPQDKFLCVLPLRSKKMTRLLEIDAKSWQVITRKDRQVDWMLPFVVDNSLYYGVLETSTNKEWSIRRADGGDREKILMKSMRTLSIELGNVPFWVEYGGRERRYFPLFSKNETPAHILRGPANANLILLPGGDTLSVYEDIFARWAAEKGDKGSTVATVKLLTR